MKNPLRKENKNIKSPPRGGLFSLFMNKKTLLVSCCAPCSCAAIEKLVLGGENFGVLFYNPNIFAHDEYLRRLEENKKFCAELGVEFIELEYNHDAWLAAVKSLESEPDRGKRCSVCFAFRFKRAVEWGAENGYTHFSSVLGVSRYKDIEQVHAAALAAAAPEQCAKPITYDNANYRLGGLEERRRALIKQKNMYNQEYCGCEFSQQQLHALRKKKLTN